MLKTWGAFLRRAVAAPHGRGPLHRHWQRCGLNHERGICSVVNGVERFHEMRASGFRSDFGGVVSCQLSTTAVSMASGKQTMAKRLQGTGRNIWVEFANLVAQYKPLNLGQGFPDFFPPKYITDALQQVTTSKNFAMHQYTRSYGHPRLVEAISKIYGPLMGRDLDPYKEILVTGGAYGSLFCSVQGLLNPGEEAIIIEPFFDCYEPMVTVAGGTPVFVPLRPSKSEGCTSSADWTLDPEELESKFTDKTKLLFFNNPNNPLGKVYTEKEMKLIADLCKKHDVIVLADEVYEWMVYKPNKHLKIANLPDMWERTVTISSAGKTFSVTGWKIGWAIGPAHLISSLATVHQNCVYTCATPIQEAVAMSLELESGRLSSPDCYLNALAEELRPKRDRIASVLAEVGFEPVIPEGGYFILADFSKLGFQEDPSNTDDTRDAQFIKWMIHQKKVSAIPPSAFYCKEHRPMASNLIRICFIKEDSTLDQAAEIFKQWKDRSS